MDPAVVSIYAIYYDRGDQAEFASPPVAICSKGSHVSAKPLRKSKEEFEHRCNCILHTMLLIALGAGCP